MRTQTVGNGSMNIHHLISGMQDRLEAVRAQQQVALAFAKKAREKIDTEYRRIRFLKQKRFQRNLSAATVGLARIIELAQSPEIQHLIKIEGALHYSTRTNCRVFSRYEDGEGEFMFFLAEFISEDGEGNDQHAGIFLKPDRLVFSINDYDVHDFVELSFKANPAKIHKFLVESTGVLQGLHGGIVHADTLRESFGVNPLAMWRDSAQHEFTYPELFGRVLIDCANKSKFEQYCATAFAWLTRK